MKKPVLAVAVVALLAAAGSAAGYRWVNDRGSPGGGAVKVVVTPGSSGSAIAERLAEKRVVSSSLAFRIFLRLRGGGSDLKAGEYALREAMPFDELLAELRKGPEVRFVRLTIPEGFNLEQIAARVSERTHISRDQFLQAAATATVRPAPFGEEAGTLEGLLYPKTYFVSERETAESLVGRLVAQFEKETARVEWARAATLRVTPYQALVIASLIEEEAKEDVERPQISAVIHNRLRLGMKLEIDATIQFAVRKYDGRPLTQSDLEIDSPYNTRRYPGIPPGPIASPRLLSIVAALEPASSDAIYFVLTPDCKRHLFTASYREFLRAKQQLRRDC